MYSRRKSYYAEKSDTKQKFLNFQGNCFSNLFPRKQLAFEFSKQHIVSLYQQPEFFSNSAGDNEVTVGFSLHATKLRILCHSQGANKNTGAGAVGVIRLSGTFASVDSELALSTTSLITLRPIIIGHFGALVSPTPITLTYLLTVPSPVVTNRSSNYTCLQRNRPT